MTGPRVLARDVLTEPLPETVPPGQRVVSGSPRARLRRLTGGGEVGPWEIGEGTVEDVEQEEIFLVLSGAATVTFDDGETVELRPGTCVRLHTGDRTTWVVHTPLRKLYLGSS